MKVRLALEKIAELENLTATEEDLRSSSKRLPKSTAWSWRRSKSCCPPTTPRYRRNKAIDFVRENAVAPKAKKKTTRKSTAKKAKVEEEAAE